MKLQCSIPLLLHLVSSRSDESRFVGNFERGGLIFHYELSGQPMAMGLTQTVIQNRYVQLCDRIVLTVEDEEGSILGPLVESRNVEAIHGLFKNSANRVISAIRNYGLVPHLAELGEAELDDPTSQLKLWELTTIGPEGAAQSFFPDGGFLSNLIGRLLSPWHRQFGEVRVETWPDIAEAIHDDLHAGPEREFLVNSIEHIRQGNFRYALLEAVICLEIVLSEFLKLALERRGLSRDRIGFLLNPNVGLTARVGVLLDLALERPLPPDSVQRALRAIRWRNLVVHERGRLPSGIGDAELREGIQSLLRMAELVARTRDELHNAPIMGEVVSQLKQEFGTSFTGPFFSLRAYGLHRVSADVSYLTPESVPDHDGMQAILSRMVELLIARDPGFEPTRHLFLRFVALPEDVRSRYSEGRWYLTVGRNFEHRFSIQGPSGSA